MPTPALSEREQALAAWARRLLVDPNVTSADDVERLRSVGLDDREIFEATAFVALRFLDRERRPRRGAGPAARGRRA